MIWESTFIMTLIDVLIVSFSIALICNLVLDRKKLEEASFLFSISLLVIGVVMIGVFYLLDLATMWILPLFVSSGTAMEAMENLHLNYSWIISLVAFLFIFAGLAKTTKELLVQSTALKRRSLRLAEVQEEERRRLSQELHDEVGGLLSVLQLTIHTPSSSETENNEQKQAASDLIDSLTEQIRSVSLNLRPRILDESGLSSALNWLIHRYMDETRIKIEIHNRLDEGIRFGSVVEISAFRIVQEALTNVARHAGTESAVVKIWQEDGVLEIQILDDGVGFTDETIQNSSNSMGLTGMKERAALLGGVLTTNSVPGTGTTISARLPI